MRTDIDISAARDAKRDVSIFWYTQATWTELIAGQGFNGRKIDFSPFTKSSNFSANEGSINFSWSYEFNDGGLLPAFPAWVADKEYVRHDQVEYEGKIYAARPLTTIGDVPSESPTEWSYIRDVGLPKLGTIFEFYDNVNSIVRWRGYLSEINSRSERKGERRASLALRSRDAAPVWRNIRWSTDVYPAGTDLSVIVEDILNAHTLEPVEYPTLGPTGHFTPHSGTQFADMASSEILRIIYESMGRQPVIDCLGRFATYSRDVSRVADFELTDRDVLSIEGGQNVPQVNALIVKWLDRILSKSSQMDQSLASTSITAGFFKLKTTHRLYWSDDHSQRAENTYMVKNSSINDGLLPVGDESYSVRDDFSGVVQTVVSAWVPTLATVAIVVLAVLSLVPDFVEGYVTEPFGRVIEMAATIIILLIMVSLGTGNYEIFGEPFDWIHAINKTEAMAEGTNEWTRREAEISNDLIVNEAQAQWLAVLELLHRYSAGDGYTVKCVDIPKLERGDLVCLPYFGKLFVEDYSLDTTRGADQVMILRGFRC